MNLGTKSNGPTPVAMTQKGNKMHYPSFSISDAKVDDFMDACPCELDDVLEATVKLKVTGLSSDQYGKRISFDVLDISDAKASKAKAEKEEDDDEPEEKTSKVNKAVRKMMKE